jgi:sigma-B regulation protein RsbU (phosphoserine phosphatase)
MSDPRPIVPVLELIRGGRIQRVFEINGTDLHIGRTSGSEVKFNETKVSRNHARVERRPDGSCYLVDLNSQNKTYVDDRRLEPFQPVRLSDGCRIKIVDIELIFRDPTVGLAKNDEERSTVIGSIDDLSSQRLARRVAHPAQAFEAILDVNRALGGGADLNEVLGRVLDGLMAVFPRAERGFILTTEPDGTIPLRAVRYRHGEGSVPTLSRTIARQVLQDSRAVLIADASSDEVYKNLPSVALTLRTALAVPLRGNDGGPVGMVQIDSRTTKNRFAPADLDLLAALAVPVGVAVENHRLLREQASWAAAGEIQRFLLPRRRPDIPGYTFWECYRPAEEVGGDLYDYIPVGSSGTVEPRDRRWAVTVGDVAGKGMPAALMMAGICPEVRHLIREGVPPHEVLTRVNRGVCETGIECRFVTVVLAEIDPRSHRLTISNAGHLLPLIRRSDGAIEEVGEAVSRLPLGVRFEETYPSMTVALEPGDVVVLYSDGVTDAMDQNGRRFGDDRFDRALAEAPQGADAVGEALLAAVREYASGRSQFDDITLLCFGRNPE